MGNIPVWYKGVSIQSITADISTAVGLLMGCSTLVVDGHDGVGPYIADFSVKRMPAKAETQGSAFCGVRNSNGRGTLQNA
jgi:LDH2 family malate/lactate/ureidoglycolate dehydrogenase